MYPRNAVSPERLAIGQVVLIADGTVQTTGVSIVVRGQGGAEAAGGGTTAYGADGTVYYTPTQAETNYTSFVVIAYKASCFSASQTVITTASATPGRVVLSSQTHTGAVIPTVSTVTDGAKSATALSTATWTAAKAAFIDAAISGRLATSGYTAPDNAGIATLLTRIVGTLAAGTHNPATAAQIAVLSDWINGGRLDLILDIIAADTTTDIPAQISALNNVAATDIVSAGPITTLSGAVVNVDTVDVTTTNTDMRGTDNAATAVELAKVPKSDGTSTWNSTALASINAEVDTALAESTAVGIKKNTAFSNFEFLMVDATDHVTPEVGLTVTGQRSIDGGAFATISGTIAEVSNGIYQVDLLAADTNGDVITYRFSSAGAADRFVTVKTRA